MCYLNLYLPYVDYDYIEVDSLVREPRNLRGELPVDPDTSKKRRRKIIQEFSHYIRLLIFQHLLTERHTRALPSMERLNEMTKAAIIHIIKHVDVSGDDWEPKQCISQVEELLAQFLHNFRYPY